MQQYLIFTRIFINADNETGTLQVIINYYGRDIYTYKIDNEPIKALRRCSEQAKYMLNNYKIKRFVENNLDKIKQGGQERTLLTQAIDNQLSKLINLKKEDEIRKLKRKKSWK